MLVCGGLILTLAMGIRHGFGLFLQPMSADLGWGRETFALAMAVQNLVWGATQPFTGMLADRHGTGRIVVIGALLYVLGLVAMAHATSPLMMVLGSGVLIGTGLSGVTFSVVSGVLGRKFPAEKRSMALGISAAAGSFGQFAMLPVTQWLLSHVGWYGALLTLGGRRLADGAARRGAGRAARGDRARVRSSRPAQAMREALGHRGYVLLTLGFFVCGFQVVFVGVHLPAYLADHGLPPHVAVTALALDRPVQHRRHLHAPAGWAAGCRKRYILSAIYFGRAVVIALFFWLPLSPASVYAFAIALGLLWLSTVPPTNGIVAGDLRRPLPGDALRLHVLQPPDRQLPGRVARRPALRHDRQLRRRLVDLDRAGHRRRAHQPADRRARDRPAGRAARLNAVPGAARPRARFRPPAAATAGGSESAAM